MKILIAGDYFYKKDEVKGGIATVIHNLIQGYKNKNEVDVIILSLAHGKEKNVKIYNNVSVVFKRVPRLPQTLNAFLFEAFVIKKAIKEIKPEIVHAHNMTGYAIGAIKSGYPHIITPHGDWIAEQLKNSKKLSIKTKVKVFIWRNIYSYIFRNGKYFTAISPYVEHLILSYNPAAKIFSINNALGDEYFSKKINNKKEDMILWAGRICHLKRLDKAVEAFELLNKRFPELVMEVAGKPDGKTIEEFRKIKQDAVITLKDKIVFRGALNKNEMMDCYDRAKIFLLTSEQEASPMVIVEAMARGCVPVANNLPGLRHLIRNNLNGIVVSDQTPNAYKKGIELLLENDRLVNILSKNSHNDVVHFKSDEIINKYIMAFKEIIHVVA